MKALRFILRLVSYPLYPFKVVFGFILKLSLKIVMWSKLVLLGIVLGFIIILAGHKSIKLSSTDEFCNSCHVHPHVTYSWKKSTHFKNNSGVVVHCVDCHLPAGGLYYLTEKARLGIRDAYGAVFKDAESFDWDAKSMLDHAKTYTYDSSCMKCHSDLYSLDLKPKGVEAHEYYMKNTDKLRCINCHLTVGHYHDKPIEEVDYLAVDDGIEIPEYSPPTGELVNYTENILDTGVTFNMIAIPGGTFTLGSPEDEPFRDPEETQAEITISPFWMGEIEVSWREFDAYYSKTADTSKKDQGGGVAVETVALDAPDGVDAVTGPTPAYGSPDQGWGKGLRPVITISYNAAVKYCEWLSGITGDTYRLPTEAEWEYACRAGSTGPYFFEGDPKKLTKNSLKNKWFGRDLSVIDLYVYYGENSKYKTQLPYTNQPNPWGLYNMLGNVKEFCLDWYSEDAYAGYSGNTVDPRGPSTGKEHVVRGGSFNSDPSDLRIPARDRTYSERWYLTDPQSPKSIWWYSDTREVGFRVVREY